jgi:hypothetical protein
MITAEQFKFYLGVAGLVSVVLNLIFIVILIKFGRPVLERFKALKMSNPTYIIRIFNKNRIKMDLVDYKDGIVKFGNKTYIKDPELIIRHKPFDMAYFYAEDCRPLNLAEVDLLLDPEVYTRQLELAEMAGAARMVERLVEELMKVLTPYLIAIVVGLVLVGGGFFILHQQGTQTFALLNEVKNLTISAMQSTTII